MAEPSGAALPKNVEAVITESPVMPSAPPRSSAWQLSHAVVTSEFVPRMLTGDGRDDFVALISQEHEAIEVFENRGDGTFEARPLPTMVQVAPVNGIAVLDINGDGLEDFYVGGAAGFPGTFFIRNQEGFEQQSHDIHIECEDMGVLLFDANGDGVVLIIVRPLRYVHYEPPQHVFYRCFVALAVAGYGHLDFLGPVFCHLRTSLAGEENYNTTSLRHADSGFLVGIKKERLNRNNRRLVFIEECLKLSPECFKALGERQ